MMRHAKVSQMPVEVGDLGREALLYYLSMYTLVNILMGENATACLNSTLPN